MSAASRVSASDQLMAPAFFTNSPEEGIGIEFSTRHWVRV